VLAAGARNWRAAWWATGDFYVGAAATLPLSAARSCACEILQQVLRRKRPQTETPSAKNQLSADLARAAKKTRLRKRSHHSQNDCRRALRRHTGDAAAICSRCVDLFAVPGEPQPRARTISNGGCDADRFGVSSQPKTRDHRREHTPPTPRRFNAENRRSCSPSLAGA